MKKKKCGFYRFNSHTKRNGRHWNFQCSLDGSVHKKTFGCKRHEPIKKCPCGSYEFFTDDDGYLRCVKCGGNFNE